MIKYRSFGVLVLLTVGCSEIPKGTFYTNKLVSSKGEAIYVNSINWGVTDDNQLSIISKDRLKLKDRKNTEGAVNGLSPFIYHFMNDTLTLYFYDTINYKISESFNTIVLNYKITDADEHLELIEKIDRNEGYYNVPFIKR